MGDPRLDLLATEEASPEARAVDRDLLAALLDILGQMNRQDAEAILAAADIIDRPDVAPATFRKRLQRALGRLKNAWGATKP